MGEEGGRLPSWRRPGGLAGRVKGAACGERVDDGAEETAAAAEVVIAGEAAGGFGWWSGRAVIMGKGRGASVPGCGYFCLSFQDEGEGLINGICGELIWTEIFLKIYI